MTQPEREAALAKLDRIIEITRRYSVTETPPLYLPPPNPDLDHWIEKLTKLK